METIMTTMELVWVQHQRLLIKTSLGEINTSIFPFLNTFTCEIVFLIPAWSSHKLRQGSKKVAFKSWCPSIGQHLAALNFEVSFQILKLPPMHGARCHCHCQMSKDDNEKKLGQIIRINFLSLDWFSFLGSQRNCYCTIRAIWVLRYEWKASVNN